MLWLVEKNFENWNIQKIETSQEDDYIIGCLIGYVFFKSYYKMVEFK